MFSYRLMFFGTFLTQIQINSRDYINCAHVRLAQDILKAQNNLESQSDKS